MNIDRKDLDAMVVSDIIVIGGGLVGSAVAYGLARNGAQVTVLDEGDQAFRASRGNFGLVWVQGKGYGATPYANWTCLSASLWPELAESLFNDTAIDIHFDQPGGLFFTFSDEEHEKRRHRMEAIREQLGGDYAFEMLDKKSVLARVPNVGPDVYGASFTPMDGHVNPLKLLKALHAANLKHNVKYLGGQTIKSIVTKPVSDGCIFTVDGRWQAKRLVLAAGLGNRELAEQVGLTAPVTPVRGQMLISERTKHFLDYPTLNVRQTDEGTIQLGDSKEEVGFDDSTTTSVLSKIARQGVRTFPLLAGVRLVRAWGALRVMSPDGLPIYDESAVCPGAFVVSCHSGVTLAPVHALRLSRWITSNSAVMDLSAFQSNRFTTASA